MQAHVESRRNVLEIHLRVKESKAICDNSLFSKEEKGQITRVSVKIKINR